MPSNISPQHNQQLEDYLISLKLALETSNFEALDQLVDNHADIMNVLKEKIYQEEGCNISFLKKAYDEVFSLILEAQNLKEELSWSLRVINKKKRQIESYVKS